MFPYRYTIMIIRSRVTTTCALLGLMCMLPILSQRCFAYHKIPDPVGTLETVRELVKKNELSLSLIKMDYTVKYNRIGYQRAMSKLKLSKGIKNDGRTFTHINGVWAQDNVRQHCKEEHCYSQDEVALSHINIIDGEVAKWGKLPDLMQGSITEINKFDWNYVIPAKLGIRPFEGKYLLSETLIPENASVHDVFEMVDGRKTYVIDIKRPEEPVYFARMWIDSERALPLRIKYFNEHPSSNQAELMGQIDSIKLHQLSNGGLMPVEGTRSVYLKGESPWTKHEHIKVDINSITIRREDIPDDLFKLEFPKGAIVNNEISGKLKTKTTKQNPVSPSPNTSQLKKQDTEIFPGAQPTRNIYFNFAGIFISALVAFSAFIVILWIIRYRCKIPN